MLLSATMALILCKIICDSASFALSSMRLFMNYFIVYVIFWSEVWSQSHVPIIYTLLTFICRAIPFGTCWQFYLRPRVAYVQWRDQLRRRMFVRTQ